MGQAVRLVWGWNRTGTGACPTHAGETTMEGRTSVYCAWTLSLGLVSGLCGCVPQSFKNTSIENRPPAPKEEILETKTTSFFKSEPKREPKLELAMGMLREKKAAHFPDNPEVRYKELDEARKVYQEILAYDSNNVDAQRGLGRVYLGLGDFERAQATYTKAAEKHPKTAAVYADWSVAFSKRNDFKGAVLKINQALELEPENQEYHKMLGINLVCLGQVEQGVEALAKARGRAAAHYYVARLLYRKNQADEARQHLQRSLQANPNLLEAQAFLQDLNAAVQNAAAQPATPQRAPATELHFTSDE